MAFPQLPIAAVQAQAAMLQAKINGLAYVVKSPSVMPGDSNGHNEVVDVISVDV